MEINWKRCNTYDDAKNHYRVIYLHEWNDKPFYWGKAHNSYFGGQMRTQKDDENKDFRASGRYNPGYRHWIEGCLRHGAKLYIGQLSPLALTHINEVENWLMYTYGYEINSKVYKPMKNLLIKHSGDVPASISQASPNN